MPLHFLIAFENYLMYCGVINIYLRVNWNLIEWAARQIGIIEDASVWWNYA